MAFPITPTAYWKLEDVNATVGGFTLTNNNTVTFTTGKVNLAGNFNGSNQSLTNSTYTLVDGALSVSSWIKADTLPSLGNYMSIVAKYQTAATTGGIDLRLINDGTQKVELLVAKTTGGTASYSVTLNTSVWYHLVGVYSGTTVKLYLNGSEVASTSYSGGISTTTRNLCIGCIDFTSGNTRFFDGQIDEVGIWDRALTTDEISALYNSGNGASDYLTLAAVSYYKLDESSGNASDSVGSNTLTNTSVTYSAGKINNGAVFDSASSSRLVNGSAISFTSLSLWIYPTTIQNKDFVYNATADYAIGCRNNADLKLKFYDGSAVEATTAALTINTWNHITLVRSGGTYLIYKNGVYIEAVTVGAITFEMLGRTSTNGLSGTLDEVGIWSRALSADEVSQLFNSNRALAYPLTAPTLYGGVAYYKLDESSGNASDSIGSRTLTNTNTVTYSTGKINNGANFVTASSQYFTFTPVGLSNSTFSISGWFYSGTNQGGSIYQEGISGNNNPYIAIQRGGANGTDWVLVARDASAVGLSDQWTADVTRNTWHHFVWTMTTTQSNLYLDGNTTPIRTTNFTANSFTANVGRIGNAKRVNEESFWGGSLDEIGVWNRALSSTEITSLYNSGSGLQYPFTTSVNTGSFFQFLI